MTFAEKVKDARCALGLTQFALAERVGVTERTINGYEKGRGFPKQYALKKIAKELGVTVEYLVVDEVDDPKENLDREIFLEHVQKLYGRKGAEEAAALLTQTTALFAGGTLDDEAKEIFLQSIMEIFMESKSKAREKFTPKSRKREVSDSA